VSGGDQAARKGLDVKVFTEAVTGSATLTAYVQDRSDELSNATVRPAVLVLPGGGYGFCSDREAEPIALAYLAEGFNAFVLRYAVGPDAPWEQSFADGKAGLSWVRAHAAELDIDPAQVAVVGFSAGGHLATSLGTLSDDRPNALVLGYPVTLAEFGPVMGKEVPDTPVAVTADTPPTFLFSTYADALVPIRNSLVFLTALAEHDVPFESHIYALGSHGLSLAKPLTANGQGAMTDDVVAHWLPDSVRFLHRVLGEFALDGPAATFQDLTARRRPGLDMPLKNLLDDERAVAVMEARMPGAAAELRQNPIALGFSLREVVKHAPELADPETLAALEADLVALNG
jgi:acetyl esterase/lipase